MVKERQFRVYNKLTEERTFRVYNRITQEWLSVQSLEKLSRFLKVPLDRLPQGTFKRFESGRFIVTEIKRN